MLLLDIEMPKSCAVCLCSCKNWDGTIWCRHDMNEHTPGDETCPIKGELKDIEITKTPDGGVNNE